MVTTLVRLGFDDPESLAVELEALGAWPPRPGANGHRLLEELAASANPTLATRALAAIAQATSDPGAFAAGLRPRPELVRQARAAVPASAGVEAGWRGLRRFRRRELLRVAVRDLDGGAPVDSVGAELANLADACLQAGLELATRAQAAPGDPPVGLAVLAMGKLGGRELNYVSDIDVLFCHEPATGADAELAGKLGGAIARELIAGLGGPNPEGPGFQVDPNLRPEGRNGPLTRTLGSYLAYWDRWAEPWELQALIKVRPAAGDRRLGERFVAEAARRVYPERFDPTSVAPTPSRPGRPSAAGWPAPWATPMGVRGAGERGPDRGTTAATQSRALAPRCEALGRARWTPPTRPSGWPRSASPTPTGQWPTCARSPPA